MMITFNAKYFNPSLFIIYEKAIVNASKNGPHTPMPAIAPSKESCFRIKWDEPLSSIGWVHLSLTPHHTYLPMHF